MNDELIAALMEAGLEIQSLRRENQVLRAKTETMDLLAAIFFTKPPDFSVIGAPDIAYTLQQLADKLKDGST